MYYGGNNEYYNEFKEKLFSIVYQERTFTMN